ncbi:glycerol-3-phosphate dehydrogenase [Ferruginivarius sediminum]|uniref:glycerol-3-phosphate dehydrogenase n=1 Tax=Ferruginivarius sediminum TaxID=2661937 RepID=UPI001F4D3BEA|nr:glycerol-3-phosphate dehydrogenase [Ferruginivarius sediminum]
MQHGEQSLEKPFDLAIIGGGINGAGIARDAAGRGMSVLLCEQGDLAQATSAASTKLIHGGLRYLEYMEFRLVREALIEREVLLELAPHIIWPLTFVLPHAKEMRPAWMVRLGLFLYDHLGGRKRLPGSRSLDLRRDRVGAPLKDDYRKGFSYSDCWVEDSRLVVLNALDAAERGAEVLTGTRCTQARRTDNGLWEVRTEPVDGSVHPRVIRARALVNAAGPWVTDVLRDVAGLNRPAGLRLVKGSHMVVPRLYEGDQAYILQNDDRRIVFAIPYERQFTLLGTTDKPWNDDAADVAIDDEERAYICRAVNRYFKAQVRPEDAVWSYSGVRPLYDDANENVSAVTRDYVFDIDGGEAEGTPPLLSVFGGKITTYRRLAEHAMEKLLPLMGQEGENRHAPRRWTATAPLPGGDMPGGDFEDFLAKLRSQRPWLPPELAYRYARAYGTRVNGLLGDAGGLGELGTDFGGGLYQAEVDYLVRQEFARTAEDVLWRRSKLGLHVPRDTEDRLREYLGGTTRADDEGMAAK